MRQLIITALLTFILCSCSIENSSLDSPIVVLCFDDCHIGIYETAFPIMQEYDYIGTNVSNSGRIGETGYFSWNALHEMEIAGWETASHTEDHTNLIDISVQEAEKIITDDIDNFHAHGIFPVSFALPAGLVSKDIYDVLIRYFSIIRKSQDTINHYPVDAKAIGYFPIQTSYSSDQPIRRIQSAIYRKECMVILGFHRIQDVTENVTYNCTPDDFRRIMDFIKSSGLEVLTLKDAVKACI